MALAIFPVRVRDEDVAFAIDMNRVRELCTKRPEASNFKIGSRLEPAQLLSPQRSNTHTLPLPSTSTALVDPQDLFSFAQPCSSE